MSKSKEKILEHLAVALPITIGFTFPFQVLTGEAAAGAGSILVLLLMYILKFSTLRAKLEQIPNTTNHMLIDILVVLFLFIITTGTVSRGFEGRIDLFGEVFMLIQAGMIYFFYSRFGNLQLVRNFLIGVVVVGVTSAIFFCFDSFGKIILGTVSTYALMAHEYVLSTRGQEIVDPNLFRIKTGYRSFGLLERHTTSALWIIFAFFALLFLSVKSSLNYFFLFLAFGIILFVQNFTSLFTFTLLSLISFRLTKIVMVFFVTVCSIFVSSVFIGSEVFQAYISHALMIFAIQVDTALTFQTEYDANSYTSLVLSEVSRYITEIHLNPHQLFVGFGVGSSESYGTSGDVGFVESIMRLGLPLWIFITTFIGLNLIKLFLFRLRNDLLRLNDMNLKSFVVSTQIMAAVWLMDVHYSAWIHKSVWPLLFFSLAVMRQSGVVSGNVRGDFAHK